MYQIQIEQTFTASHQLHVDGHDEPLHEHPWKVQVLCEAARLNRFGMVMDFRVLRGHLLDVIAMLTSLPSLNEHPFFQRLNPSAEAVAQFIYENLARQLPASVHLSQVKIEEETGCWGIYLIRE